MLEAVSSRLEACSSVRCDRSALPAAISLRGGADGIGGDAHFADDAGQACRSCPSAPAATARFHPLVADFDALRQVAVGHALGNFYGIFQRTGHRPYDQRQSKSEQSEHGDKTDDHYGDAAPQRPIERAGLESHLDLADHLAAVSTMLCSYTINFDVSAGAFIDIPG